MLINYHDIDLSLIVSEVTSYGVDAFEARSHLEFWIEDYINDHLTFDDMVAETVYGCRIDIPGSIIFTLSPTPDDDPYEDGGDIEGNCYSESI